MLKLRKYFIPGIFVLPMILHWILPWSIESKLYISVLDGEVFVPDILYIVYLWNFITVNRQHPILSKLRRIYLVIICAVLLLYVSLCLIAKNITYAPGLLICNMSMIWFALVFMLAPLSREQIQRTKPFITIILILLICEVLLYSLGILTYTTANNSRLEGMDYGGVMRISTTIGAATGTAVIIGLLGAVTISIYKWKEKTKWALIIFTSIGIFYTMSRGTSLLWIIFIGWIFYKDYFKYYPAIKRLKMIVLFAIGVGIFFAIGGFDPIMARNDHMKRSNDYTAERGNKLSTSLKMIEAKEPWGYGLGQVFPEKAIAEKHKPPHPFAPHNAYMLLAIELGWPGLILYISLIILLLSGLDYKCDLSYYILLVFIINANTESIILDPEYMALIMFAIMCVTRYNKRFHYNRYVSNPIHY